MTLLSFFTCSLLLAWLRVVRSVVIDIPDLATNTTFDYIIVGGGTAELTVAGRLSENPNTTILVIERGYDNRTSPTIYNFDNWFSVFGSDVDWSYATVDGRSISAGRTLGGSSSINGATWTRGSAAQYDALSTLLDPKDRKLGWDWDGLFQYMKKAEDFTPPDHNATLKGAAYVPSFHGYTGPVKTCFPDGIFGGPQQGFFRQVMTEKMDLKYLKDLNGGDPNCVSMVPNSLNHDESDHRSSSATAYLSPIESVRDNWTTLVGYQVVKINFAPIERNKPRKATGVTFGAPNGPSHVAYARKEVILAAGAIGSPFLLQHSGIGNAGELATLGIPSVIDLPTVGLHLQDQPNNGFAANGTDFDQPGKGPHSTIAFPNLNQLFGPDAKSVAQHIRSSLSAWATSQASSALSASALLRIFQVQAALIIKEQVPLAEMFSNTLPLKVGVVMWNLLPFSRGSVKINSSDPFVRPVIDVNWFSVDFDLSAQIATAEMIRRTLQSYPLSTLHTGEITPGFTEAPQNATDAQWEAWIKKSFVSNSHPLGTCAMMAKELGGVVDGHLRVYGSSNVRVVDASVLPLQISAHLSSTVYGVAEKAADLIKADQQVRMYSFYQFLQISASMTLYFV